MVIQHEPRDAPSVHAAAETLEGSGRDASAESAANRDATAAEPPGGGFDPEVIRQDFPVLGRKVHGKPLVYLDNAATTQKPLSVLEAMDRFYRNDYANVHRGVHELSERANLLYEGARERVRRFLSAESTEGLVFTRGATEGINLVAYAYGEAFLREGDEVLVTALEHHSNIVPWQMACERRGARLVAAPIDERGQVIPGEFERLLGPRTRLAAVAHVSNALGTVNDVSRMARAARAAGAHLLIDGAQAVAHQRVDLRELDCDFYVFSGHKLYGPTGIGALYGRPGLLEQLPPWQGGGDMISSVRFERTEYNELPFRFEAGTPNIAGAVGLAAALDYIETIGLERIAEYEKALMEYATSRLEEIPGLRIVGTAERKSAVISFTIEGTHPSDLGTLLDLEGVAIRSGHHCAQPVMDFFGLPGTARASFALYNTREEVDALVRALEKAVEMLRV